MREIALPLAKPGSPQTVISRIKDVASEGWFNTLFAELSMGQMSVEELRRSAGLFTAEVRPALRGYEPY